MAEKENKEKEINEEQGYAEKQAAVDTKDEKEKDIKEKLDAEAGDSMNDKEENLEEALEEANKNIADIKDKYLRTLAEFDNYKKRTLKEKAELILNGSEKTVSAILPVLDDFERALKDKSENPDAIREGVKMIFNKFEKVLESLGVKKIDTDGKDFDTDFHEAVAMVPGLGDDKKGKVIECVQTGYTINDKVLRHAKVAVGQ